MVWVGEEGRRRGEKGERLSFGWEKICFEASPAKPRDSQQNGSAKEGRRHPGSHLNGLLCPFNVLAHDNLVPRFGAGIVLDSLIRCILVIFKESQALSSFSRRHHYQPARMYSAW